MNADSVRSPRSDQERPSFAPLWLALAIILCLHVLVHLVQQSMMLDGVIYAAIARNLAAGDGSLWHLQFSGTLFSYFAEHPPLMIWLQSAGFWLFGDSIAVERGFAFITIVLNGAVLIAIWRELTRGTPYQGLGVFVLILTLVAGRIGYAFANGLIENLQMIFTSAAVLFMLMAYRAEADGSPILKMIWMMGAGLAIALALLTKGPVGLFPLVIPILHSFAFRLPRFWGAVRDTAMIIAVVVVVVSILLLADGPRAYIDRYLHDQLISSVSGARGGAGLWKAISVFIPVALFPLLTAGLFIILSVGLGPVQPRDPQVTHRMARSGQLLLAIAVAGSFPIFVSPRVASFYFNPSLPFYAMALASVCAPFVLNVFQRASSLWLRRVQIVMIAGLLIAASIVTSKVGEAGEDREVIGDARRIATYICPSTERCGKSVASCASVWEDWQFHAYMGRNHRVDLVREPPPTVSAAFYLTDRRCGPPASRATSEIDIGLKGYRLYRLDVGD